MAQSLLAARLLQQQNAREEQLKQHNIAMFKAIPNITTAIELMVDLPEGDLSWDEIVITDGILVLGISISFPSTDIPIFVQIFAPSTVDNIDTNVETIHQFIRLGMPMELVDQPSPVIVEFFRTVALSSLEEEEEKESVVEQPTTSPTPSSIMGQPFDTAGLTPDQTQALLMFQDHLPKSKH